MLWIPYKILYNFVRSLIFLLFINSRLHLKTIHKKIDPLFLALHVVLLSLDLFLPVKIPVEFVFLLYIPYAAFLSKDKWYIVGFWLGMYAILYVSTLDVSFYVLVSLPNISAMDVLRSNSWPKIAFLSLFSLLLTLLLFLVSRFKKEHSRLSWTNLFLFFLSIFSIFLVEHFVFRVQALHESHFEGPEAVSFLMVYLGLCACTIISVVLFQRMSAISQREMEHQAELDAIAMRGQHQQEVRNLYDKLSILQHNIKQHTQTLSEMARQAGSEEAQEYLKNYEQEIASENLFSTGSPAVDALLTAKSLTMQKAGIRFDHSLYPLNRLPMSSSRFCNMLGNLMDNAIEGVQRISGTNEPVIQLRILRPGDMLCLILTNPCDPKTLHFTKARWLSSKVFRQDGAQHPIGIRTIQRIVDEADGTCDFLVQENKFIVKILLPYPAEQANA